MAVFDIPVIGFYFAWPSVILTLAILYKVFVMLLRWLLSVLPG